MPGGNLSNEYFWNATETNGSTDLPTDRKIGTLTAGKTTASWAMTLDNYYDMLKKTNSTGSICINYSYARYGTSANPVTNAAHYAANWVRYDKGRTRYWEIGNENYGSWEAGYKIDTAQNKDHQPALISGALYGKHCLVFIDSMRAAAKEIGSDIKIGVVTMEVYVSYDSIEKNWNAGLMPQIADKADFLIVHSYYTPYNQNSTITTILNSAANTHSFKDYVLNALKKYGNKDTLPVALTEWNIFANGSKQAPSYINGLHGALVLGELIKNKYGEATRWDLFNGWGTSGDDMGLFASSDEPGVTVRTPHAPFFYMYYFQKYFGEYMVNSNVTGNSNIISYASSFSSGQSGVVIINKDTTQQIVNLQMNNFPNAKSYYRYVLTGGTDNGKFSRKVYVNGAGPTGAGGGPTNYTTLNSLGTNINGKIKFAVPPLSATYLLVSSDSLPVTTGIKNENNKTSFNVYPNPAKNQILIDSPEFAFDKIEILDLTGKKVFEKNYEKQSYQTLQLNINLNSGLYILKLYQQDKYSSAKLLIE